MRPPAELIDRGARAGALAPGVAALDDGLEALVSLHWRLLQAACRAQGLSPAQHQALARLSRLDGARVGRLSEALGLSCGATSSMVDRLVEHGWACREPRAGDRRCVTVHVTPDGQAKLDAVRAAMRARTRPIVGALTPGQLAAIEAFLDAAR
jgi:DNA-binding MarR family transcriptional regulator